MKTLLERVEEFEAKILLLGGDPVEGEKWDEWLGWDRGEEPDEDSILWECHRKWDFPTMTVTLRREDDGHKVASSGIKGVPISTRRRLPVKNRFAPHWRGLSQSWSAVMKRDEFEAAIFLLGGKRWAPNAWSVPGLQLAGSHGIIWDTDIHIGACIENEHLATVLGLKIKHVLPYDKMLERIVTYLEQSRDK